MLALLPILLQIVPSLASLVSGGRTDSVLETAGKVAREVFGTDNPDEIGAKLNDPAMAEAFKARMEAETAALQAQLADVQDARHMAVQLVQADSPIAWAPVVISGIIMGIAAGVITAVGAGYMADNSLVVGAALAWVSQVIAYWIGSSSGSRRNGDAMRTIATQAFTPSLGQVAGKAIDGLAKQARR